MAITQIDGHRQIKAATITNTEQNFGTPSTSTDVAIKSYVDSVAQGLSVKPSAAAATTTALSPTNTYSSGVLTATGNGTLTVDGYAVVLNDYILVMNEASGLKNGLYKCTTQGTAGVPYVLTRAVEMDVSSEFTGAFVFVEQGTVNASSGWVCTNIAPTVGTTAITFTQFSGAGEITAGNGLSKAANTLSIDTSITVDKTTVQTLTNKTFVAPVLGAATGTSLVLSSFINEAKGTDIASATTTNIGAAIGNYVNITGTTTITAFDTVQAGARRILNFNAALILTYNATSLILPSSANITTVAGDTATFVSLGSGNWVCTEYQRRDGTSLVASSSPIYMRSTVVAGTQDGSNKIFTIANSVSSGSEQIFVNGSLMNPGSSNDYVLSGTTFTFQSGFTAPASTDTIRAYGVY